MSETKNNQKDNRIKCDKCGDLFSAELLTDWEGEKLCEECLDEITGICYSCGGRFLHQDLKQGADDESYCASCFNDRFSHCDYCGRVMDNQSSYNTANGGGPVCETCYNEHFFTCESCGEVYSQDNYGRDGMCESCAENEDENGDHEIHHPDNNRYHKKSRRDLAVGIEIEAEGGDWDGVCDDLYGRGFGIEEDGSLDDGIEIQIPASNNGRTSALVKRACRALNNNSFSISKKCGLHIHIEYGSQFKTIKNLLLMAFVIDPILFAVNPESRRHNTFCLPLAPDFKLTEILENPAKDIDLLFYCKKNTIPTKNKIRIKQTLKSYKKDRHNRARYFGFNLHSLFNQKTVEFRHHAGTMDAKKILNWVELLKKILYYVRFNFKRAEVLELAEISTLEAKLKRLADMIDLDPKIYRYFLNRYMIFR